MGLMEFLRQWQPGRLAAGVAASVAIHLVLMALILWGGLPASSYHVKRGEPLIVELPKAEDSPPPGLGGAPVPQPSAPTSPAAPPALPAAAPAPRAVAQPAPRPEPARRPEPTPRAEPERRVASAPLPKAPDAAAPASPAPAPSRPDTAQPTERALAESELRPPAERQVASVPPPSQPAAPGAPDILTALRRGSGGAGGRGDGRGGIEGEPIPLDSTKPEYSDYLDQVRRRIKAHWGYPCVKNPDTRVCEGHTTSLDVDFGILKDGRVQFVEIVRRAHYEIYDDFAVNAIKLASPFPPVPSVMMRGMSPNSTGLAIRVHFSYVLIDSSLTNLLLR